MTVLVDVTERPVLLLGWDPNRIGYPTGVASGVAFGTAATVAVVEPDGVGSVSTVGTVSTTAFTPVDGVSAVGGGAGTPSVTVSMHPTGVSGSETFGSPQTNSTIVLTGVASGLQFGATTAFTSMNPSGFSATGGGPGSPVSVAAIAVTGMSSGTVVGTPDIIATVFVVPGPIDPSNDFGDTQVLMRRLIFRPPTQTLGWGWYKRFEGISLIKKNGVWSEVPWPTVQETLEADVYLPGGRDHAVSTALAAELISEGYSISEEY